MVMRCICDGDGNDTTCICNPDVYADFADSVHDYHRDRLMLQTDKWERRMEKLSLLKSLRRSDVDEV